MHNKLRDNFSEKWELYVLLLPAVVLTIMFKYFPMYGLLIAFKDYDSSLGILGSPWAGMKYFESFFGSYYFKDLLTNTLKLSFYDLIAGFPLPLILALMLNQVRCTKFKKTVQMVTYAPHFISVVVLVSMINVFFGSQTGIVNKLIMMFGGENIPFMEKADCFRHLYVWSGIWQGVGWGSIVYIAALSSVSQELHEAASVDGANKLQRIFYIDLPSIVPTIMTMLILKCGQIMSVGFEKVFLMQNPLNITSSSIISTYVYEIGLQNAQYSLATTVGLFNSVINLALLLTVNYIAKKVNDTAIW